MISNDASLPPSFSSPQSNFSFATQFFYGKNAICSSKKNRVLRHSFSLLLFINLLAHRLHTTQQMEGGREGDGCTVCNLYHFSSHKWRYFPNLFSFFLPSPFSPPATYKSFLNSRLLSYQSDWSSIKHIDQNSVKAPNIYRLLTILGNRRKKTRPLIL